MFSSVFEVFIKILRILLKEEYIRFDFGEIRYGFLQLLFLIKKAELVERFQLFCVLRRVLPLSLLDFVDLKDKTQQCMEENEVILSHRLLLSLIVLDFDLTDFLSEHFVPFLLEPFLTDDLPVFNARFHSELWRVSASSKLGIKFAELPFELLSREVGYMLRNDGQEDETQLFEFCFELLAVELERAVHDAAVVEASDRQLLAIDNILNRVPVALRDSCIAVIAPHTLIPVKYITESVLPFNSLFAYNSTQTKPSLAKQFYFNSQNNPQTAHPTPRQQMNISNCAEYWKDVTKQNHKRGRVCERKEYMYFVICLIKMNNELHTHSISKELSFLIFSTINSNNGTNRFCGNYVFTPIQLVFINDEFTEVLKHVQFDNWMKPARCAVSVERPASWHIVLASSERIHLLSVNKKKDNNRIRPTYDPLPDGFEFTTLSKSLALSAADVMLASTKCGSLFVIVFKRTEKEPFSLKMIKVSIQDKLKCLFKWFMRSKNGEKIINEMFLMRIDQFDNFFRLLSIRNEHIDLSIVHLSLQTGKASIKKTHTNNITNSLIRTPIVFKQAVALSSQELEPREYQIIAAYQKQGEFITLVRISITIQSECKMETSILAQYIPSKHFLMVGHNHVLYYTYFDAANKIYPLIKCRISRQGSKIDTIHHFKDRIYFANVSQLFVFNTDGVFLVSTFQVQDSDDSEWLEERDRMNVHFHDQIARSLENNKYSLAATLLGEKTNKLMRWIQGRSEEDKFQEQIQQEILCSLIVKDLFNLYTVQQLIENPNMKDSLMSASTCQSENVRKLLEHIINDKMYAYFIRALVRDLLKTLAGKINFNAVRQIYSSPTIYCLKQLKLENEEKSLSLFKQLLSASIDFMPSLSNQFAYLIERKQLSFVRHIIAHHGFHEHFVRYFANAELTFTFEELQMISNKLEMQGASVLNYFVRRLLSSCKEMQAKNINFMGQKLEFIVKGLFNYYKQLLNEINEHFSGLIFFFYLYNRTKNEDVCIIHELATKCPTSSEINTMFLSILYEKGAIDNEVLLARICKFIGLKYNSADLYSQRVKQ